MTAQRGSMLLELVIAAAITCVISIVLFRFAFAAQAAVLAQGIAADQQQRLRVAVEALRQDLLAAGAGPSRGAGRGPLADVMASVVPARIGSSNPDPELSVRFDRLAILYVPETRAQTLLRSAMAVASSGLAIDVTSPGCAAATACDFAAGDRAVIYELAGAASHSELFTVAGVDSATGILTPSAPLGHAYGAGARVTAVIARTYYLDPAAKRVMVYDSERSDVPLIDHAVDLRVSYLADPRPDSVAPILLADLGGSQPTLLAPAQLRDGPLCGAAPARVDCDLLRVRRVRVSVRVESESSAASVPDAEAVIDIAPPNMAGRR